MKEIEIKEIPINKIHSNVNQPRETFNKEKIEEMANSIKEVGLLHPITVRLFNDGYQIIAGERRFKAFQMMNKKEIQAKIIEADDLETEVLSIIENYHREELAESERYKSICDAWKHGKDSLFKNNISTMSKFTGIKRQTLNTIILANNEQEENPDLEIIQKSTAKDLERTRYLKEKSPESRNFMLEKLNADKMTAKNAEDIIKHIKSAEKEGLPVKDIDKIISKLKDPDYDKNKTPEDIKTTLDISTKLPSDLKDKVLNGKINIEEAKVASSFPTVEQRNQVIQERRILAQRYKEDEQRHITLRKKMSDDVALGKKLTTMSTQFDVRKSSNDVSSTRILERYQNIHIEVLSYRSDHIMSIENKDIQDRCVNVIKQTLVHCNQVLQAVSEHKSLLLNEKVKGGTS